MHLHYFFSFLILVAFTFVDSGENKTPNKTTRPNIVFILADDVNYNSLSCYGGKNVSTPHIDKLANEGLKFNRAYSAMSMCAPFRAELYTGLYPVKNGVAHNHGLTRADVKSVFTHLKNLGYRVGLAGKQHVKPRSVYPYEYIKGKITGNAVKKFMTRDSKKPFCLFLCSNNAHAPWNNGDKTKFDSQKIKLAPIQHDNAVNRELMTRYLAEVKELDNEVGAIDKMISDNQLKSNTLFMFSSEQGWAIGFANWTNWEMGLHTALIARWPGKIPAGVETNKLVQIADVTPTLVAVAGGKPGLLNFDGLSFDKLFTNQDHEHRRYVFGCHNNVPEGKPYPIRSIMSETHHYLMNLNHAVSYHESHIMDLEPKVGKHVWWTAMNKASEKGDESAKKLISKFLRRPAEELYLVKEDPYSMNNLAMNKDYRTIKDELKRELKNWMQLQKDTGANIDTKEYFSKKK